MERTPNDPSAAYYAALERLAETQNLPYDEARAILGPPPGEAVSETAVEVPAQRQNDEYRPVRDAESGKELPHYYGKYEPLTPEQVATTHAGVASIKAMLAAKKRAREQSQ